MSETGVINSAAVRKDNFSDASMELTSMHSITELSNLYVALQATFWHGL